jgi:hypothetical protein
MVTVKSIGSLKKTETFLKKVSLNNYIHIFDKYAKQGVVALSSVTPVHTGETANSWSYIISEGPRGVMLTWTNSNMVGGKSLAIMLHYGYATRSGKFVQGRDYIRPALRPIMDKLANELWKEVRAL